MTASKIVPGVSPEDMLFVVAGAKDKGPILFSADGKIKNNFALDCLKSSGDLLIFAEALAYAAGLKIEPYGVGGFVFKEKVL